MVAVSNNAEGQPSGTTATQGSGGNTGGVSGDFFTTITVPAGGTFQFDNTHAAHGTNSYKIATGATAGTCVGLHTFTAVPTVFDRFYMSSTDWTSSQQFGGRLRGSAVQVCRVVFDSTGHVQLRDTANTAVATGSVALSSGTWYRVEYMCTQGAAGTAAVNVYPLDSMTTVDAIAPSTGNYGTNNINESGIGMFATTANVSPIWFDDLWTTDAAYPGPAQLWTPQPSVFVVPIPLYRQPSFVLVAAPQTAIVTPATTTPPPLVVTPPAAPVSPPPQPILVRSSLADVVASSITPSPLVIGWRPPWTAQPVPLLLRSSIQDFATPVTRGPLVVTQQTATARPQPATIIRSTIQDFATPVGRQPLVATWPSPPGRRGATIVLRSTPADPVVNPSAAVQPLIVSIQYRPGAFGQPVLIRPGAAGTCTVTRPGTGTVIRPAAGTVARPSTGLVTRPGTGTVTRPNTGLVVRPGCH